MFKSALGVALSLLFVIGTVPVVDAVAATGEEQAVEQAVAKSAGHAKHKRRHHASVASLDAHEKLGDRHG